MILTRIPSLDWDAGWKDGTIILMKNCKGVNQRTKDALSDEFDDLVDQSIGLMMVEQPGGMQNANIQLHNIKIMYPSTR